MYIYLDGHLSYFFLITVAEDLSALSFSDMSFQIRINT